MIDLQISREEQTPEGVVSLDAVVGRTHDGEPILARHLLAELDIAATWLAGLFNDDRAIRNLPPIELEQCRADLVAVMIQHEDAARERQKYLIREVDRCGIHAGAPSHICGKLCPTCEPCASRTRLKINDSGALVEVKS